MAKSKKVLEDDFITLSEASKWLHVGDKTLRGLIYEGKLPGYQLTERNTLLRISDILKYLEECRIQPTKAKGR